MDIERRLKAHMADFSDRVEIPADRPLPTDGPRPGGGHRSLTVITAALVLVLAGAGVWMLSSGPTASVAAGDVDDFEDSLTGENASISVVDVTSEPAPGLGFVQSEDGTFYVLSFGWTLGLDPSVGPDALYERPTAQVLHVLEGDGDWRSNELDGDRSVVDFKVHDGVLYALGIGAPTAGSLALGTSADDGASWEWSNLDGIDRADEAQLFVTDDEILISTTRHEQLDFGFDWVVAAAAEASITVTETGVLGFDTTGFSYLDVDPSDACAVALLQYFPDASLIGSYLEQASSDREREAIRMAFEESLMVLSTEPGQPCGTDLRTLEDVIALDLPTPKVVTWDEIGVTIPEEQKASMALYSLAGGTLTRKQLPFESSGAHGWGHTVNDRFELVVFPSVLDPIAFEEGVRWTTTDGDDWRSEPFDEIDGVGYYSDDYREPVAGQFMFRVWWGEAAMAFGTAETAAEGGPIDDQPEILKPVLQRSIDGETWESIDHLDLGVADDLSDLVLQDVQGSSLGVFVTAVKEPTDLFTDFNTADGLQNTDADLFVQDQGTTILFSSDGVNWESFTTVGSDNMIHSDDEAVLILSHPWSVEPGSADAGQVLLVRPKR